MRVSTWARRIQHGKRKLAVDHSMDLRRLAETAREKEGGRGGGRERMCVRARARERWRGREREGEIKRGVKREKGHGEKQSVCSLSFVVGRERTNLWMCDGIE